jgi:hypothetical protein
VLNLIFEKDVTRDGEVLDLGKCLANVNELMGEMKQENILATFKLSEQSLARTVRFEVPAAHPDRS